MLLYLAAQVMGTRWAAYTLKDSTLVTRPASWTGAVQLWLCGVVWKLALNVLQYSSTRSKMAAVNFSTTFSVK